MRCGRCREPITYRGDWPGCPCDDEPGLMLTIGQAAAYICVSRSKVRDMIARGELIINRTHRPARIPMTSIKASWASDHRAWRLHEGIYRDREPR